MSLASNGSRGSRVVESVSVDKWTQVKGIQPYIAYVISVRLPPVQQWTVKRRYNEFVKLATALTGQDPPHGAKLDPPVPLPPKHAFATGWHQTLAIGSQVHAQTLAAERLPALQAWVQAIVQDSNPIWRSSRAFRAFLALPDDAQFKMSVPHPKPPVAAAAATSGAAAPSTSASASHLGSVPGSWNGPTRRLGSAYTAPNPPPAQETATTRGLDDQELFQSQANVMNRQDAQLRNLAAAIRRQRDLGLDINQELREHSEMLNQLDRELDGVQDKMSSGRNLMRKLDHDRPY